MEEVVEGFELSRQQKRLWSHGAQDPFVVQCVVSIDGPLDHDVLRGALRGLISRHEILRTSFHSLPGMKFPVQVIAEDVAEPELRNYGQTRIAKVLDEERRRSFDLKRAPLIRFGLLKLSHEKHVMVITQPSMCADAESLMQFVSKLSRYYAHDQDVDETVQHVDFSEWQHEISSSAEAGPQKEYWRKHVETALSAEAILLPHERVVDCAEFAARRTGFRLSRRVIQKIDVVAGDYEVSAESVLLSCWQVLLARLAERSSVVVGQFCNGRRIKHLWECLGPLGEFLPVQARIDRTSTFADVLRQNENATAGNRAHQEYFTGDESLPLPFQFDFVESTESQAATGVRFSLRKIYSCTDRYKVRLSVVRQGDVLACELRYDETKFAAETAKRLAGEFKTLLKSAIGDPESLVGDLEVLSDDERRAMLFDWNQTASEYRRDVCLHELFEEQVARTPERTAVVFRDRQLSFAELNERADELAQRLRGLGVGPEVKVALFLERSVEMVVGVLAVWKAGGAYVPLDITQPQQRLQLMLEDADVRVVLTQAALRESVPESREAISLDEDYSRSGATAPRFTSSVAPLRRRASNLAYIIYTSGSTGAPKGVMVTHRSAVNLITALQKTIYAHHPDPLRVSVNAQISFDASVKQLVQLLSGHTLVVIPEEVRASGPELLSHITEQRVDVLDCTPSQLQLLLTTDAWNRTPLPRTLLIGGESVTEELWNRLSADTHRNCYNVYGPTECTVDASVELIHNTTPNIGRPIANTRIYLVDQQLRPVPIGVRGEICIAGECLARGYLNAPGQTALKFIPEPFSNRPGARMYRTGDLGRYLPDGRLEFLGRIDHQVKVRGVRIELGEIEAALRKHDAVRDALVQVREDVPGDPRIVAYLAVERRYLPTVDGRTRYQLPNGLAVLHQNKNETDYLFQEIFENRTYIRHGIELPDGACVVDVGANIGLFTLFVLEHSRDARVYAFEPIEPIFDTLKLNVELYGKNVKLFPFGLSDRQSTASFTFYPHYSMMSGLSDYARSSDDVDVIKRYLMNQQDEGADSLLQHADEFLPERFVGQSYQSQLRILSEIIRSERLERIDLLKIDVQRAELDVLKGIDDEDWQKIRQVVMEAHDAKGDTSEGRLKEISSLLEQRGFSVTAEQDDALRGTDRYNLYAVRNGSVVKVPETEKHTIVTPLASASEFRRALKEQLPEYMIPSSFVLLEKLPLTRNGKVDRAALAALDARRADDEANYVAPQNQMEQMIARIWQEALRVERVGANDNFFELGGHSLLMAQVHSRLVNTLGRQISMVEMFQHPTVGTLAKHLSEDGPRSRSLNAVQERAARQKEAMDRQQPIARKVSTAV